MKATRIFFLIPAVAAAAGSMACSRISSNEVDASSIYGQIDSERAESSSSVDVTARFWVGGSTGTVVNLVPPAGVTINGVPANEINDWANEVSYRRSVGASSGSATVTYTDRDSKNYVNTIPVLPPFYASAPGTASKAAGFSVTYTSGGAFGPAETLYITLDSGNRGTAAVGGLPSGASSGALAISVDELQHLAAGMVKVTACREVYPSASNPFPKGLLLKARSCANPFYVNLTP